MTIKSCKSLNGYKIKSLKCKLIKWVCKFYGKNLNLAHQN